MTPEERAREVRETWMQCKTRHHGNLVSLIKSAIRAAVAEEREAIAVYVEAHVYEKTEGWDDCQECGVRWKPLVAAIRARDR